MFRKRLFFVGAFLGKHAGESMLAADKSVSRRERLRNHESSCPVWKSGVIADVG